MDVCGVTHATRQAAEMNRLAACAPQKIARFAPSLNSQATNEAETMILRHTEILQLKGGLKNFVNDDALC